MARVVALTRRRADTAGVPELVVQDLTPDLLSRTGPRAGPRIDLRTKKLMLLEVLMRKAGRVVTRTMLLERVWNFKFETSTSVVETHVIRLRAKVDNPFDVSLIHAIRNTGCSMRGPR